jgi:hypothetical protein
VCLVYHASRRLQENSSMVTFALSSKVYDTVIDFFATGGNNSFSQKILNRGHQIHNRVQRLIYHVRCIISKMLWFSLNRKQSNVYALRRCVQIFKLDSESSNATCTISVQL